MTRTHGMERLTTRAPVDGRFVETRSRSGGSGGSSGLSPVLRLGPFLVTVTVAMLWAESAVALAPSKAADSGGAPDALAAPSGYYRHAIFDNSRTPEAHYASRGSSSGSSGLRLVRGRIPVDTAVFHSAPNALRLQWWSAENGYWEATLESELWRNRGDAFEGDALIFWAHAPEGLTSARLPRLSSCNC